MQFSRTVQTTALATSFRHIRIAFFQKLKYALIRQVKLVPVLSILFFHTFRKRENPREASFAGVGFNASIFQQS